MQVSKVQELFVGKEFKNFKELCLFFEIEPKGGKGKKYQLAEFERYFKFSKDKQKFTVTEILEEVQEKVLVGRPIENGKELDLLLKSLLENNKCYTHKEVYTEVINLIKLDGNEIFFDGFLHEVSDYYKCDKHFIKEYRYKLMKTLFSDINASLNRLEKEEVLLVEKIAKVHTQESMDANPDDPQLMRGNLFNDFLRFEKETYDELQITPFQKMFNRKLRNEFNNTMIAKLNNDYNMLEFFGGVIKCWKCFEITRIKNDCFNSLSVDKRNELVASYTKNLTNRINKYCIGKSFQDLVFICPKEEEKKINEIKNYCKKMGECLFVFETTEVTNDMFEKVSV